MSEMLGIAVRRALADGVAALGAFEQVSVSSVPTGGLLPTPCCEFGDETEQEKFAVIGQAGTGVDEDGEFAGVVVTEVTDPESLAHTDTSARDAEDEADALYGAIADFLASDRTLGGTCLWCRISGVQLFHGYGAESTRACKLSMRFAYKARAYRGG
jgi:hypothetical protein